MRALLVYALATGTLVALAAWAVEGICRARRTWTRWIWAVALLATGGLTLAAALSRTDHPASPPLSLSGDAVARVTTLAPPSLLDRTLALTLDASTEAMRRAMDAAARAVPAPVATRLLPVWMLVSAATLLLIALVHARIARVRRAWPRADLHGHAVRVAPAVGPAVLGIVEPFIVVPRWLLARSDDEQRLVLAHEAEHVRARDHLLLAGAWVVAALMPWHPAVWWMLARLRLAIELDCDARVLRRGIAPRTYGTLLIDLASQCRGLAVGATALADESSHLERRLRAMKPMPSRYTTLRAGALLAAGLLATLAACEAKLPTSADVEKMDVTAVEKSAHEMRLDGTGATFYVDGVRSTADAAHAIAASRIASVDVAKQPDGSSRIDITTLGTLRSLNVDGSAGPIFMKVSGLAPTRSGMAPGAETLAVKEPHGALGPSGASRAKTAFAGILLIDGVRAANPMALHELNPDDIVSVNVIKGARARQLIADPAAENGVIQVTTKAGAKP